MSIATYTMPTQGYIKQGDTIPSYSINFSDDYTGDFTTAVLKMQVIHADKKLIDISSENGITIVDSNNCTIDKIATADFPIGTFKGDFQITEANGDRKTWFNVEVTVIEEFTENT